MRDSVSYPQTYSNNRTISTFYIFYMCLCLDHTTLVRRLDILKADSKQ